MSLPVKPLCYFALAAAFCAAAGPAWAASPLSVLAAFERAWEEGEADVVEETLASDKIALSLSDAGPQDEAYTRTQALYLIKDALAYRITESFGFVEFYWSENGVKDPHGIARWRFSRSEGGPPHELMLKVTLRLEGQDWVVSEIRLQADDD
jgi:hypothetical protein